MDVITEASLAPPKMFNPIAARVLKLVRETLRYVVAVHLGCKGTWRVGDNIDPSLDALT
jgi:hypothetical protein